MQAGAYGGDLGEELIVGGEDIARVNIRLDYHVAAGGARRQGEGGGLRVALAALEDALVKQAEDHHSGAKTIVKIRVGGEVNGVGPALEVGDVGAVVGDAPVNRELVATPDGGRDGGSGGDGGDLEVGGRSIENGERRGGGPEIIVIERGRVLGVHVNIEGELENLVPGVGINHDLVNTLLMERNGSGDDALVILPDRERAGVAGRADSQITP